METTKIVKKKTSIIFIYISVILTFLFCALVQVNVVKGLKLYNDIFTDSELSKLSDFVNEIRTAGQNGELSGKGYCLK